MENVSEVRLMSISRATCLKATQHTSTYCTLHCHWYHQSQAFVPVQCKDSSGSGCAESYDKISRLGVNFPSICNKNAKCYASRLQTSQEVNQRNASRHTTALPFRPERELLDRAGASTIAEPPYCLSINDQKGWRGFSVFHFAAVVDLQA